MHLLFSYCDKNQTTANIIFYLYNYGLTACSVAQFERIRNLHVTWKTKPFYTTGRGHCSGNRYVWPFLISLHFPEDCIILSKLPPSLFPLAITVPFMVWKMWVKMSTEVPEPIPRPFEIWGYMDGDNDWTAQINQGWESYV